MSLFRSEEHVQRWLHRSGLQGGTTVTLGALLQLARAWYPDPRNHEWRPRTRDESQAVLAAAGFVGDFWMLPLP